MPTLYGKTYTRQQLMEQTGLISQLGSVTPFEFTEGPENGSRGLLLENAAGLRLIMHPDRCLDIGSASYKGMALAWTSPTGFPAPSFYEPEGRSWLRSFGGGLIATCGLTNVGVHTDDQYGQEGLHGRIGNTPATAVTHGGYWRGNEYALTVTGTVRQACVFAENLVLRRTVTVPLDRPVIAIEDTVTNEGHDPSPFMLLYHCNFGFPLISPATHLIGDFSSVTPRDDEAEAGKELALSYQPPTEGYKEKCYWLEPRAKAGGEASVALENKEIGLRVSLSYDKAQMPCLTQWKMMGQGAYVVGIEPGNVLPLGRAAYLKENTLPLLSPGETQIFEFEITVDAAAQ